MGEMTGPDDSGIQKRTWGRPFFDKREGKNTCALIKKGTSILSRQGLSINRGQKQEIGGEGASSLFAETTTKALTEKEGEDL